MKESFLLYLMSFSELHNFIACTRWKAIVNGNLIKVWEVIGHDPLEGTIRAFFWRFLGKT
jgi:hypothetical protein